MDCVIKGIDRNLVAVGPGLALDHVIIGERHHRGIGRACQDAELSAALDVVARVRMAHDADTRAYVERRRSEGRTPKEIKRTLKRYISRQVYRQLTATMASQT